jgi:hypothetical protein
MVSWYLLVVIISVIAITVMPSVNEATAQTSVQVDPTTPCFLNFNSTHQMWDRCNAEEDFLDFALLGWEYGTGGYFSMMIVGLFVLITYIKYHNPLYPMMVGTMFLPVSYLLFPDVFVTFALIMVIAVVGIFIWYAFVKQTKEYA